PEKASIPVTPSSAASSHLPLPIPLVVVVIITSLLSFVPGLFVKPCPSAGTTAHGEAAARAESVRGRRERGGRTRRRSPTAISQSALRRVIPDPARALAGPPP